MPLNMRKARSLLEAFKGAFGSGGGWNLPDLSNLSDPAEVNEADYETPIDIEQSVSVLNRYGLNAEFKDYFIGPSVSTFIYSIPLGTKLGTIYKYEEDIARDLGVNSVRIVSVPGHTSCIGLEVENSVKFPVSFKELADDNDDAFSVPLGSDTFGKSHLIDIRKQPHLMVAGQTGSGKSVFLNTTIASLISKCMPNELKLLLVDPKQVEFSQFEDIPHLMEPIACDLEDAYGVVDVAVDEMERRFSLLRDYKVKKISDYNKKVPESKRLPYVVLVVDEFADLMMMGTPKERKAVENKIVRIAQKARAVGIHLILATQKPLATVVTSLIKANMPAQVAFKVQKSIDSKVILDETGAENLSGKGDLLFTGILSSGKSVQLHRVQAPFLSDEDLETIIQGGLNAN
jgi:S-DNA-T family DNA segregation ATPase FtsK/SpoIIIE